MGVWVTANKQDSRVSVVHGSFSEGGDSILSTFNSLESLCESSCNTTNDFLWLDKVT